MRPPPFSRSAFQRGFTLLELVIVVIIIGILAAVAVPGFFNLADKAEANSVQATAANLGSAAAMNYGACKLGATGSGGCKTGITTCALTGTLVTPTISAGAVYSFTETSRATGLCSITKGVNTASFPYPGDT